MAGSNTCGVGGWGGPLPGDPDNNATLHARAAFGGIDVYWSLPATNPFAVAYTKVWRSVLPDFNTAIVVASVGGDFFYDKNDSTLDTVYYYWIQFVSVNGTVGEEIGPDQAQSRPPINNVISLLSGDIEESMLSTALRAQLGQITTNYGEFVNEVTARDSAIINITDSLASLQTTLDDAIVLIGDEITSRQDGDSALVQSVNSIALVNANALALIESEQQARIDGDEAIVSDLTVLATQTNDPLTGLAATRATLQTDYYTKTGADSAVALAISGLETTFTDTLLDYVTSANLTTNYYTIAQSDTAIATATQNLVSTTDLSGALGDYTTTAALQENYYTKTGADGAISSAVTSAQTTFDGNLAAVELSLNSAIGVVNGELDSIGALYTAKVVTELSDGTKMIGGFGIYNDGTTVDAGFDVNTFWVGKPAGGKKYPFIISGGEVFIDQAVINELTFTKLRDESGLVVVENGKLKAEYLKVATASIDDAAITNAKIGALAVTAAKIADAAITSVKIDNAAITSAKISDAAITTAKIGDAQVDTLRIAGNAVTIPISAYTAGSSNNAVTAQSATIASSGAPIAVFVSCKGSSTASTGGSGGITASLRFEIRRNGVVLVSVPNIVEDSTYISSGGGSITVSAPISYSMSDTPGIGTHTYTLHVIGSNGAAADASARSIVLIETRR